MNITRLAENLGLEPEEYLEILEILVESGQADIDALEQSLKTGDAEGVMKAAHSLKGAAANLGLTDLSEIARDIESNAREQDLDGVNEKMDTLKEQFALVVGLFQT